MLVGFLTLLPCIYCLQAQPGAKTTPSTNRVFSPYKREDSNSCENTREGTPGIGPLAGSCTGQYMLNGGEFHVINFVDFSNSLDSTVLILLLFKSSCSCHNSAPPR